MQEQDKLTIQLQHTAGGEVRNQQIYEGLMDWKIEKEEVLKSEFIEQVEWLPVVTFLLGTITTGFLKAIGSEIWTNVKEVFGEAEVGPPGFEFKFNYEGVEIIARIKSDDLQVIEKALGRLHELVKQINFNHQQAVIFIWTAKNNWQQK